MAFHSANQSDNGFWKSVSAVVRLFLLQLGTHVLLRSVMSFLMGAECTGVGPPSGSEVSEAGNCRNY